MLFEILINGNAEFCSYGSLITLLHSKKPINFNLKVQIMTDVASGMVHLQVTSPKNKTYKIERIGDPSRFGCKKRTFK